MRRLANVLALFVVVTVAYVGWLAFKSDVDVKDATGSGAPDHYSDLSVAKDDQGHFDGTIVIENTEDIDVFALVSVNLYDGDQNVGELSGNVVLKPDSESSLDLFSLDEYVEFDEARVDVDMLPQ